MKKKNNFFKGVLSLVIAQIVIKILGMIYSLYLTNKRGFGDTGNAIYMSGYQVFALFLTISSIGVPNAISKLISEKLAKNDEYGADRIFKIALTAFAIVGFIETSILFLFAKEISNNLLQIKEAEYSLMFLSPAIFFVSISSVIEGYFNGKKEIKQTAKAQSVEQLLKMICTIIFVEFVAKISGNNTEYMAASASFATTIATILSVLYLYVISRKIRKKVNYKNLIYYKKEKISTIVINIAKVSIPLAICSMLVALYKNIDALTVVRILKKFVGEELAQTKYGILTSKVDVLLTVPLSFNMAFTIALIPEIASAKVRNDEKEISDKISFSLFITMILAIPSMFGIYCYAEEIIRLLFPNAIQGAELLKISAFVIPFEILVQTINGSLQGLGKHGMTTLSLLIGGIVKLIGNIVFINMPIFLEKGAIISTICCYCVVFFISGFVLIRNCKIKLDVVQYLIKPMISSFIMIILSKMLYAFLASKDIKQQYIIIISILFAVIVYILVLAILMLSEIIKTFKDKKIFFVNKIKKSKLES